MTLFGSYPPRDGWVGAKMATVFTAAVQVYTYIQALRPPSKLTLSNPLAPYLKLLRYLACIFGTAARRPPPLGGGGRAA